MKSVRPRRGITSLHQHQVKDRRLGEDLCAGSNALLSEVTTRGTLHGSVDTRLSPIYDENVHARIWRTALTGPPTLFDDDGWPQYTQGAHNNTPPSDTEPGVYVSTAADGWTAGFFPDSLWQLYHRRRDLQSELAFKSEPTLEDWLATAQDWTDPLIANRNLTNTHDIGFLAKPFQSALRFNRETRWLPVLGQMSYNLASRFVPTAGVIRSWDTDNSSYSSRGSHEDSVLVIIDNMMNLALLMQSAVEYTHNDRLREIAASHANRTRDNHFRPDGSSYHVCDYSGSTGDVYLCRTAQGLSDNSTWARGQAWAIYGFAEIYSLTKDPSYLETAMRAANYFIEHLPQDGLPFWDFDAPYIPNVAPRDSSAATIAASGLMLLQQQIDSCGRAAGAQNYTDAATRLLRSATELALAGEIGFEDIDQAKPGASLGAVTEIDTPANTTVSSGFESILMHGTANNNPNAGDGRSYDTGLVYGDYYLIEASNRLLEIARDRKYEK
ncbi:uncharacterized protein LTR77_007761 [Saxophila tyrrhenica]|uniref:Uncharacterized protein n=1 Tax=Saxophila tyrrhenica TaxID=1690608 RepID=A0AAV9P5Z7_9PEZI|nr:hypothetical protein LTR77_007761 [Saxophila tyrrhenica]